MEVDLIAETAVQSTAPVISENPPAARLGEEEAVDIAAPEPMPAPPLPEPIVRPTPAPTPKQVARPKAQPKQTPPAAAKAQPKAAPKATPKKQASVRPTGRLDGIDLGQSKSPTKSTQAKGAPASAVSAETRRAFSAAVDGEIRPHWQRNANAISGVELDQLRLRLDIHLNRDGSIADIRQNGSMTGKTESNAPQQKRFVELAVRSIRQAAPFNLPPDQYDGWKVITQPFRMEN
ncbi:hypothetical protein [Sphingopyxis sp. L1A2A]|uniref:hypothetical protein n=1 Tax=Sphingopyxis sp. L1A2A TaxID=2502247 RepID=UPI00201657E8|nr:hypothetical protein [Sphingopyxis sp. L1A2A]